MIVNGPRSKILPPLVPVARDPVGNNENAEQPTAIDSKGQKARLFFIASDGRGKRRMIDAMQPTQPDGEESLGDEGRSETSDAPNSEPRPGKSNAMRPQLPQL
jgi:hypothetical protein